MPEFEDSGRFEDPGRFWGGGHPHETAEQQAACEAYERAMIEYQIEARESLIRFAWLYCSCSTRFSREEPVPQSGCPLHSGLVFDPISERWMY